MCVCEHFCSKTEKEIEFNDKINCVMLRTLHSEAMNESPLSVEERQVCVFVCVQLQESIWRPAGAKMAHNLVSVERSVKI